MNKLKQFWAFCRSKTWLRVSINLLVVVTGPIWILPVILVAGVVLIGGLAVMSVLELYEDLDKVLWK